MNCLNSIVCRHCPDLLIGRPASLSAAMIAAAIAPALVPATRRNRHHRAKCCDAS
jgi:hypothetical protein